MKVGSLYAGIGGICTGFHNAGFEIAWANEFDPWACKSYRQNYNHRLYEGDIFNLDIESMDNIDILAGGFPCQPFSVAGYRKGFQDTRGNHFFRMLDFVDSMRPAIAFFENVKNLVGHDKGKTFKVIRKELKARNYGFHAKVLNTKDYGNIPHNRERIFIVSFDLNKYSKANDLFAFPSPTQLTSSISQIIEKQGVDEKYYYRQDKKIYDHIKDEITRSDTVYQWRRQYVRENKSNVCPTLTANMGTGGHNVPLVKVHDGIRKLTPSECLAFQGFSKNFKREGISDAQVYKQAGNSVSIPVIEAIATNIKLSLDGVDLRDQWTLFNSSAATLKDQKNR